VKIPADYQFPSHIAERPRDFKLSWFLIHKIGVAAVPPSGKEKIEAPKCQLCSNFLLSLTPLRPTLIILLADDEIEFYTKKNSHIAEDCLRFGVCRTDDRLELAKERLRELSKYM
jgi:kynurenine aminotransferase